MASRMPEAVQLPQKPRCTFGWRRPAALRRGGCATRVTCTRSASVRQLPSQCLVVRDHMTCKRPLTMLSASCKCLYLL